jgi:hypothetical protein
MGSRETRPKGRKRRNDTMTNKEVLRRVLAAQRAGNLDAEARKLIAEDALGSQRVVLDPPYYSVVNLAAAYAGPPVVLTWAAGLEVAAFSYQIQENMAAAGFPALQATLADTNLVDARKTNNGEAFRIFGIQAKWSALTDAYAASIIGPHASVTLRLDGKPFLYLGNLQNLCGQQAGNSWILQTASNRTEPDIMYTPPDPQGGNIVKFPTPVVWTPTGSNSQLDILVRMERAVVHACDAARAAAAGPPEVALPWDPPGAAGDVGTIVTTEFRLLGQSIGNRSPNA